MSLGRLVVAAVKVEGRSKSGVARDYGVSRRWVHELVRRFEAEGEAGLEARSRRPRRSPGRLRWISRRRSSRSVSIWGRKASTPGPTPSPSTSGGVTGALRRPRRSGGSSSRRGFVTPQPQKRPKSSYLRFQADQPNERWQADTTHWQLADGTEVEILNIVDDHSRLLVASDTYPTVKAADVVASFHRGFATCGFPASVLTDNGAVFTATYRGGGRCAIEIELARLGIRLHHSAPYHPQTCGKVERFHQTLKKWLRRQEPATSLGGLQDQLDWFRHYYNTVRPHRALGRRTPQQAFQARPRAGPAGDSPLIPAHFRVRTDRVDQAGLVTLRYNSRLHHIGLGRRHAGTRVLLLIADLDIRILTEDGEPLRHLTLDPTRDYQPQNQP